MPEQFICGSLDELRSHLENLPPPSLLTRFRWRVEPLKPARVRLSIETAIGRVLRGWAPRDTWSLDGHLCRVLGAMLDHLAEHTQGWPQSPDFAEFTGRTPCALEQLPSWRTRPTTCRRSRPPRPRSAGSRTTSLPSGTERVHVRRHI